MCSEEILMVTSSEGWSGLPHVETSNSSSPKEGMADRQEPASTLQNRQQMCTYSTKAAAPVKATTRAAEQAAMQDSCCVESGLCKACTC